MSNSRLEKFIYAICGMEVDDLPTPLSRIETLWNCLITGETPDFEPLSRNEKYLMAMLNDNVDGLPEPTSRSEKLLYKIATGETDLSDVPGYLSRYEELLKQLIENGGIGGTDFEYVLYTLNDSFSTLYSTAEAPVKSAILKGQTLNSVIPLDFSGGRLDGEIVDGTWIKLTANGTPRYTFFPISKAPTLKPSTDYILFMEVRRNTISGGANSSQYTVFGSSGAIRNMDGTGNTVEFKTQTIRCRTSEDISSKSWSFDGYLHNSQTSGEVEFRMMFLEYQEGMENWGIPYFEGIQSVKMPVLTTVGKNLMPINSVIPELWSGDILNHKICDLKLKPNTSYTFSNEFDGVSNTIRTRIYDDNNTVLADVWGNQYKTFTTNTSENYWVLAYDFGNGNIIEGIQIEEGTLKTPYEPYKSNILSCNEEVTLRGIGDVKDTLDLTTGELAQRIGEVVLDGSENWNAFQTPSSSPNHAFAQLSMPHLKTGGVLSENLPCHTRDLWGTELEGFYVNAHNMLQFNVQKSKLSEVSLNGLKNYIRDNSFVLSCVLNENVVKTVVLSITDQDGQPTKLKTFNDVTHVSIEAEDLLPTVDLEVPTKIEETLSTLPTLMNDISETQHSLNEKIDAQAENIKEVSTAITEIRSDIL